MSSTKETLPWIKNLSKNVINYYNQEDSPIKRRPITYIINEIKVSLIPCKDGVNILIFDHQCSYSDCNDYYLPRFRCVIKWDNTLSLERINHTTENVDERMLSFDLYTKEEYSKKVFQDEKYRGKKKYGQMYR